MWELPQVKLYHACPCTILGLAQQRPALIVAQARGFLSVYKSRGLSVPLYLCTGSRSHTCDHAWRGRGRKDTRLLEQRSSQRREEKRDKVRLPRQEPCWGSMRGPSKGLAGATYPIPARPPPLSRRVLTPSTTLEPRLGRLLRGAMQIFVKTRGLQD